MTDEELAEYWRRLSLGEYVELPDQLKGLVDEYAPKHLEIPRTLGSKSVRDQTPVRKRLGW